MVHLNGSAGRRTRRRTAVLVALFTSFTLILTPAGAQAQPQLAAPAPTDDGHQALDDFDTRATARAVAPADPQLRAAEALDATVRWTPFGTAQSVVRPGGFLTTGVPGATPAAAARAWLDDHRALYRHQSTDDLRVHAEIPLTDDAYVVVLQQRIGGVPVSPDGMASIGLVGSAEDGWSVAYASSTLVPQDGTLTASTGLTVREAFVDAAREVESDVDLAEVTAAGFQAGWQVLEVEGIEAEQLVRPVAFPTPDRGVRPAYETIYFDGSEAGYRSIVDAETGQVRFRESIVHQAQDDPTWEVYPSAPPMTPISRPPWNFPRADLRDVWCWTPTRECDMALENDAARVPWDVDPRTGEPTFTTIGNAVDAAEWWLGAGGGPGQRPVSPDRSYQFPWTNVWHQTRCHSGNLVEGGNDIDAAVTNLFAGNWRMHDWAYHLGFTEETWNAQDFNFGVNTDGEGDPVTARAQSGAIAPGSRNNATMATRPDGTSSIMSMFVWQPQAASFYVPCVTGDYDMSVIGHEYTHMIENRMIGKGGGRSGFHAGAMGESWSDFLAMEYQNEYGLAGGSGVDEWAVGAYVTGNPVRGIRNYNMSFPSAGELPRAGKDVRVGTLNFGSMGYDIVGPQVHADSQIWSATNHDIRSLLLDRYPSQGADQQRTCADGLLPADQCPGNRRWMQIVFDAMLLMPTAPTMLDARDAYFAADLMRFGGENQDLLWRGFARRGFGEQASVDGNADTDPVPSFASPLEDEATLRFEAVAKDEGGQPVDAKVYVGNYEARATPVQSVEQFVPNPEGYNFVAHAEGYGHVRFYVDDLEPGEDRTIRIHFPTNLASASQGATATGDGFRLADLIDDTEATNWQTAPTFPNLVTVDPPSAAAGSYPSAGAEFGSAPSVEGLAGQVVQVDDGSGNPTEGCGPVAPLPAGAIALIDRGTCPFTQKVANAQAAGAGAAIVANNEPGDPFTMSGADPSIEIPSVMVSQADGGTLKGGLPATATVASFPAEPVGGSQVTIALDEEQQIRLAKASAMLLPGQNRFTALRQFELYACTAGTGPNPTCDGGTDAGWDRFLRSQRDAFPAPAQRPSSPDLVLRSFQVPPTSATHVKLVVVANQCTGNPLYQSQQHDDPAAPSTDCRTTSTGANEVRAAELQLLTSRPRVDGATLVD
ncbi:MAG: M36 family metallopeptidase [Natronosporangium sp.]